MEYLKKEDYKAIKSLIDEFIGDTILGNHLFKAIKVQFKQKDSVIVSIPNKAMNGEKDYKYGLKENYLKVAQMEKDAEKALSKYTNRLKEQLNGITKSKKKTN